MYGTLAATLQPGGIPEGEEDMGRIAQQKDVGFVVVVCLLFVFGFLVTPEPSSCPLLEALLPSW